MLPVKSLSAAGLVSVLVLAGGIASCGSTQGVPKAASTSAVGSVTSNVRFGDYAGSQACAKCHAAYVETFFRSPMHNMTRDAKTADIKGPFDGTVFRFYDDSALLESAGSERFVTITSKRFGKGIYRVTRVIG